MLGNYEAINNVDENGNPTGGQVEGIGLLIRWQNGPLGRHAEGIPAHGPEMCFKFGCTRVEPNGAFVETVIDAIRQRLEAYQQSKFKCRENALAITKLEEALHWLNARTNRREQKKVEGTHAGE